MTDEVAIQMNKVENTGSIMENTECHYKSEKKQGISLQFDDVRLSVNLPSKDVKHILHGISGSCNPGDMLAIIGPSGSGKTSLLNVLANNGAKGSIINGNVQFNGEQRNKKLRRHIGFVNQDDILFPNLTVRETLQYQARLRINASPAQHKDRIDEVLRILRLEKSQDTKIGNAFSRGVSGGERKRVSIANELLTNPSLLFLDEPTSGLDSSTALLIMKMLHTLAQDGHAICTTIHQPSSQIFSLFNKLLFLAEGKMVYYGPMKGVLPYMSSIGFHCPGLYNPSDFLLDLVVDKPENVATLVKEFSNNQRTITTSSTSSAQNITPLLSSTENNNYNKLTDGNRWPTSWKTQFVTLFERSWVQNSKDTFKFINLVNVFVILISVVSLWFNMQPNVDTLQDRISLLFFVTIFWAFFPVFQGITTFPAERAVISRERSRATYRLSAYFMGKVLSNIPMQVILGFVFLIPMYFACGLLPLTLVFLQYLGLMMLSIILSQGFGILISAVVMDFSNAIVVGSCSLLFFMLSAGFYIDSRNIPIWITALAYLGYPRYTFTAVMLNQFPKGYEWGCSSSGSLDNSNTTVIDQLYSGKCPVISEDVLTANGVEGEIWKSVLILLFYTTACFVLAYVALRKRI